jgi:DNA primase
VSLITRVIWRYHPEWEPPEDKAEWNKCLCPFHGETRKSAVVSFQHNAFKCFACDVKGDAVSIIKQQEGGPRAAANRVAESLGGEPQTKRQKPKRRRAVFGDFTDDD